MQSDILAQDLNVKRIKAHYRRAERAIKRCERLTGAVPTPAINQLRYAGNHLLKTLAPDADTDVVKEAWETEEHCRRAWFDAFDAIAFSHTETIREFTSTQCPEEVVKSAMPTYDRDMALFRELYPVFRDMKSVQSMTAVERISRIRKAATLVHFVIALRRLSGKINSMSCRIEQERRERAERRDLLSSIMSMVLSVMGALYSAVGLLTSSATWAVVCGWMGIIVFLALSVLSSVLFCKSLRK